MSMDGIGRRAILGLYILRAGEVSLVFSYPLTHTPFGREIYIVRFGGESKYEVNFVEASIFAHQTDSRSIEFLFHWNLNLYCHTLPYIH